MAIIDIHPVSESTWIADTNPRPEELDVDRIGDFSIVFARTVSANSIPSAVKIVGPDGEIADVLDPIDIMNDYNAISRRLTIHVSTPLEPLTEYGLTIDGLYDPAGESQDNAHYITFITNNNNVDLTPSVGDTDFINVVDYTDIDKPLVIIDGEEPSTVAVVRTLPTNGAYNMSPAYNAGVVMIVFSENILDTASEAFVTVERRVASPLDMAWDVVAVSGERDGSNSKQFNISLPEISTGVFIESGYEYRITVSADFPMATEGVTLGAERVITFCGSLVPMFANTQSVLMNYPGMRSYDVAMMIYFASAAAMSARSGIDPTNPSKAAMDYALYATMAQIADIGGDVVQSVQLGDLKIDRGDAPSLAEKWRMLADKAWARLVGASPQAGVKGGAVTSPFVTRDWNNV